VLSHIVSERILLPAAMRVLRCNLVPRSATRNPGSAAQPEADSSYRTLLVDARRSAAPAPRHARKPHNCSANWKRSAAALRRVFRHPARRSRRRPILKDKLPLFVAATTSTAKYSRCPPDQRAPRLAEIDPDVTSSDHLHPVFPLPPRRDSLHTAHPSSSASPAERTTTL